LHGSTTLTADLDILYDHGRDNIDRLARALTALGAVRRDLHCVSETPGDRFTYAQVAPTAERMRIDRDVEISVASLDELIRMKRATGRTKARIELETLSALRDERKRREDH